MPDELLMSFIMKILIVSKNHKKPLLNIHFPLLEVVLSLL